MKTITIIGAGMMGSAMSVPATDNGHRVRVVGTPLDREIVAELQKTSYHINTKRALPNSNEYYQWEDVSKALDGADIVVGGVSSFGIDWFAESVLKLIPDNVPILLITKGLKIGANGEYIPFPVWLKSQPYGENKSFNAVGGPCISFELVDRIHTEVSFCGADMETVKMLRDVFTTEYYHIRPTTDIAGLETAVAMKNAYAMGVSLAIGLYQQGDAAKPEKYNAQAGLFYRAVKEMHSHIRFAGGTEENLYYGAGDLYVTVFGGRTRRLGTLLGEGKTFAEALEILNGVTLEAVNIINAVAGSIKLRGVEKDYTFLMYMKSLIDDAPRKPIPWEFE